LFPCNKVAITIGFAFLFDILETRGSFFAVSLLTFGVEGVDLSSIWFRSNLAIKKLPDYA